MMSAQSAPPRDSRQSLVAAETLTAFFRSYVAAMATDRPKKALSPI